MKLSPADVKLKVDQIARIHFAAGAGAQVRLTLSDGANLSGTFMPKSSQTNFMRFKEGE
jgi:hypothetical protein